MSAEMFDILMVAALGSSAGAGAGLIIGYLTHHQKNNWKKLCPHEKKPSIVHWSYSFVPCFMGHWDIIP
jgi:membrane protein YqaA with SNARE-associated domain